MITKKAHKSRIKVNSLKISMSQFLSSCNNKILQTLNYLIVLGDRYQEIYPAQETIGQDYVVRKTAHNYLHQLASLGIIKILNRGPYKTCLYVLNDWFYDTNNRKQYSDVLDFLSVDLFLHQLLSIFWEGPGPDNPILWENVTQTVKNNPLCQLTIAYYCWTSEKVGGFHDGDPPIL